MYTIIIGHSNHHAYFFFKRRSWFKSLHESRKKIQFTLLPLTSTSLHIYRRQPLLLNHLKLQNDCYRNNVSDFVLNGFHAIVVTFYWIIHLRRQDVLDFYCIMSPVCNSIAAPRLFYKRLERSLNIEFRMQLNSSVRCKMCLMLQANREREI